MLHRRAHSASMRSEDDHLRQVPYLSPKSLNSASKFASSSSSVVIEKRLFSHAPSDSPASNVGKVCSVKSDPEISMLGFRLQITDRPETRHLENLWLQFMMGAMESLPW